MDEKITVGILRERDKSENRVSLVPKDVNLLIKMGLSVELEDGAGTKAGFSNQDYKNVGAKISKRLTDKINIITSINAFSSQENSYVKNSLIISTTNLRNDNKIIEICRKNNLSVIAMEFVPRIARAQKLDALSSQASIAGYKAGLIVANSLNKYIPLMMTAAGTMLPANVLVLGAGVAGLQAIATVKRLGADVTGYDIRLAAGEEIRSLGAKFISDEIVQDSATDGGYAKEQSKENQKSQLEFLKEYIIKADAVISTAAIPGRPAPTLIEKKTIQLMKPGSVIVDVAAPLGGNCECTKLGEMIILNNVKIFGPSNLPSEMAYDASTVYSKNIFSLMELLIKDKKIEMNLQDEIIDAMLVIEKGKKRVEE